MGHYDVVIVGARVGGSILATTLAEQGYAVLLVDRLHLPAPAVSTHFFRGNGLVGVLRDIGLLDDVLATGCPPLTRQFTTLNNAAEPIEAGPQDPGDVGYCLSVRRHTLDNLLLERARKAGASVRVRTKAIDLLRDGDTVTGVVLDGEPAKARARLVVGADGRNSWLAKAVAAPVTTSEPGHRALYYRYVRGWTALDGSSRSDAAEFSFLGDEIAYVFPSDDVTCIAASVNRATFGWMRSDLETRFDERIAAHDLFAKRFAATTARERVTGAGPATNTIRAAAGRGWALVGDAGQYQDPWTGVGMDLAGCGARLLAEEIGRYLANDVDADGFAAAWSSQRDALGRDRWNVSVEGSRDVAQ